MKRRANGMGTAYKLSGTRAKPWVARFQCGRDPETNRRKWITLGYYKTKSDAEKALAVNLVNPVSEKHRITFARLFKEWSSSHYKGLSHQSKKLYDCSYALLRPLHERVFADIRTAECQAAIDATEKSRSYKSIMKTLIGMLYSYAMENDICHKNYAQFIRIGKEAKKEIEVFTDAEIKKLFENDSIPGADLTLMLIYSGFRIQEMLNLTVFDVDLKQGIITGGLKTDSGKNRIVPIHPKTRCYWVKYTESASDRLFMRNGRPLSQAGFRQYIYYPLLESLGIKKRSPHKCRDTFATLLARGGADTLAIQQLMGHANYAFTANTYTAKNSEYLTANLNKL